jgi:hypothetical protein
MTRKQIKVMTADEEYSANYVEMADQAYIGDCVWMKQIEKQHCEVILDAAKALVGYVADEPAGTLCYVSGFEYKIHEQELTRRRQVKALTYLVQTKIL